MTDMDALIAHYDAKGYDWLPAEQAFMPRADGPAEDDQAAIEGFDASAPLGADDPRAANA